MSSMKHCKFNSIHSRNIDKYNLFNIGLLINKLKAVIDFLQIIYLKVNVFDYYIIFSNCNRPNNIKIFVESYLIIKFLNMKLIYNLQ